jgi:hypothetical protein
MIDWLHYLLKERLGVKCSIIMNIYISYIRYDVCPMFGGLDIGVTARFGSSLRKDSCKRALGFE